MPYDIEKRGEQWCVVTRGGRTHGCHDTRADAIKQQRALYKNAPPEEEAGIQVSPADLSAEMLQQAADLVGVSPDDLLDDSGCEAAPSEASATMSAVKIPVKDMALLRMAVHRSEQESEQEVTKAITIASGLSDPEVAAQTVAVIGHLADRLRTAELNQAALVDVLQAVAADSTSSRNALLEALSGITERLAEAPQVNVTVPVPEVNVNVEGGGMASKRVVDLKRDSAGRLTGATASSVPDPEERVVELQRDSSGKVIGATAGDRKIEIKRDPAGNLVGAVVERTEEEAS